MNRYEEPRDEKIANWLVGFSIACAFIWIVSGMKFVETAQQFIKIFGE